jgi:protein phosphatase
MNSPHRLTGVFSHTGRRAVNQDAAIATSLPGDRDLVAVADGMGGHAAGAVASTRSLEVLARELTADRDLAEAVRVTNEAVYAASRDADTYAGMATTLVAVLRTGDHYQIANIGDSRAYRLTDRRIEQITADHSFIAEAARSGRLTQQEAARSPWRNAVTRAIGIGPAVEADIYGPFGIDDEPHAILLCTDGVYKALDDAAILRTALLAEDPVAAARHLALRALHCGSDDNITAAIIDFGLYLRNADPPEYAVPPDGVVAPGRRTGAAVDDPGRTIRPHPAPNPTVIFAIPPHSQAENGNRTVGPDRTLWNWRGRMCSGENAVFFLLTAALLVWLALYIASL